MASSSAQAEIAPLEELAALEDAEEKLAEGWACAQQDDLDAAIELLGEALSLRVDHFGELAPECATAYYKYGCALFWKAQQETDVLGEPMSKIKQQAAEKADPTGKGKAHVVEEEEEDEEGEGADEEEESDMELAWKMLETARLIHEKQPGHTVEEADVITTLADISTEREDFETAVKDYGQALSILEELLQNDDRMLAEVCFKTCLAYQLWQQPGPAIEYINRAIATCEKRLERLKGSLQAGPAGKGKELEGGEKAPEKEKGAEGGEKAAEKGAKGGDPERASKEIGEIEALLFDMREKADELRDFAKHPNLAALQTDRPPPATGAAVESSSFDAPQLTASSSAPPITNLGVVGRGSVRITPSPAPREATLVQPKKRTLEDMMGGGGDVSFGFGGASAGVEATGSRAQTGQVQVNGHAETGNVQRGEPAHESAAAAEKEGTTAVEPKKLKSEEKKGEEGSVIGVKK